jgi:glycerol kinase
VHRAIVWQDRRTADRCDELQQSGHAPRIEAATGLVLDTQAPFGSVMADRITLKSSVEDSVFDGKCSAGRLWLRPRRRR